MTCWVTKSVFCHWFDKTKSFPASKVGTFPTRLWGPSGWITIRFSFALERANLSCNPSSYFLNKHKHITELLLLITLLTFPSLKVPWCLVSHHTMTLFDHTLCDTGELQHLALVSFGHICHSHVLFYPLPLFCLVLVLSSCLCYPAVSYPPSYKKTPPPVPPRTTTKPLISVTAQSSTESTQDAYQEGRHPRGGLWTTDSLGRPIYSSMDSLDSTKAVTMAMESAAGKRHASLGSHTSVQTCDKAVLVSKAEEYLKTPRSSIGIQVTESVF